MASRVAIVVPRCGEQVHGGAEAFALQLAQDLWSSYDVEILSTCAESYQTWENQYPEGYATVGGIPVRRFAVDEPRDVERFNYLSRRFRYRTAALTKDEQEAWLRAQGPYSSALLRYLLGADHYDLFVFLPYLYATTYFGLPLVEERAILLPLAHEEWPLYLPVWEPFFARARAMIFASPEGRETVQRRFRSLRVTGDVIHPSVAMRRAPADDEAGRQFSPYALYVGRVDDAKGVTELCEMFDAYVRERPQSRMQLVLAGPVVSAVAQHERITFLGAVDEPTKWGLLANCELFIMPSVQESLSIALLEAWSAGRPALVNGWNPVLVGQCRRSNGGIWYRDRRTFAAALDQLTPEIGAMLGQQGRAFVERTYMRSDAAEVIARAEKRLLR